MSGSVALWLSDIHYAGNISGQLGRMGNAAGRPALNGEA